MPLSAGNIEYGVVASRPDQMYGWPGICCTKDGVIVVSASERIHHVGPLGRVVVMRSADGGETWSLPQEVFNSEIDDRDASLRTHPDGTLILTSFSSTDWVPYIAKGVYPGDCPVPERWLAQWQARIQRMGLTEELPSVPWLIRSEDGGHVWGPPADAPTGQHSGPGILGDGRLIYVGTGPMREADISTEAKYDVKVFVWESTDKGDTWEKISEIPRSEEMPREMLIIENHLVETSPGHLVIMFRSEACEWDDMFLYQSHSYDSGRTWTEPEKIPVWGGPPHLMVLSSGAVLCTYGSRRDPLSVRAMLSYDEGKTWDHENFVTLYELPVPHDFGYPVTVEHSPGKLVTIYYVNKKYALRDDKFVYLTHVEDSGGIMSIRWTLT